MIEAVSSGITDEVPWCKNNKVKFLCILCVVQFTLAIPMIMQSGMYWVTLIDWYASGLPLMIAAGCEIICISWIYGVDRFIYDLKCMIGYRPNTTPWWTTAWKYITPTCIILLIITYVVFYSPVVYNGMRYPGWAEAVGWLSLMASVLCIPAVAYYQINYHPRAKGTFMQRLKAVSQPDADWGPKDPEIEYMYHQDKKGQELIPIKDGNRNDQWCRDGSVHSDSSPPPAYEAGQ